MDRIFKYIQISNFEVELLFFFGRSASLGSMLGRRLENQFVQITEVITLLTTGMWLIMYWS